MITLLLQALGLLYAFLLPGVLVSLVAERSWSWPLRLASGLTLGVLIVPLASFSAAWLLGTNIRPPLVLGVATLINAVAALAWWLRQRRSGTSGEPVPVKKGER